MINQYDPDFLLTWRRASSEGQACGSEGDGANLSRAQWPEAVSEAEALRLWLAAGGDLDLAFLYGLEIIVGDNAIDQLSSPNAIE